MNDGFEPRLKGGRLAFLVAALCGLAIMAGIAFGLIQQPGLEPSRNPDRRKDRPIVQIVREQAGAPDLSGMIEKVCPSLARITSPRTAPASSGEPSADAAAFAYSADGWLITSFASVPETPLLATFGDGRHATISEVRVDPVSGIAIAKAENIPSPLAMAGEAYPRIGQFGIVVQTRTGNGCIADPGIVGGDFLADGEQGAASIRIAPVPVTWGPGATMLDGDGNVVATSVEGSDGNLLPAPLVGVIVDELVRGTPSATAAFGFRAADFASPLSSRMGDARSGAGVAIVKPGSSAAKAGMRAGDVITAVEGRPVSSSSELSRQLDSARASFNLLADRRGQRVQLTLRRIARSVH